MEKEDLTWLGIAGKDEGLSECDFEELTSHEDFSREQRQLLSRSAERFFDCSAEIRRKYFPAFLSYTQRVLYINFSQLHIIAEEHLLKTTEPPNYIFFADQYGAHKQQQNMMDLITVVEDLNADIISCSGKNKASEFLKKYAFVPVNEFFLKKEQNTHLYFASIDITYGRLSFHTEMLKELIAAPEFKKQKIKKPDAHESSEQDNKTGLVLTKNSDSTSCSAHCLSMVQYINARSVDSSMVELLIDVLPLVIAPREIGVYGKDGEGFDVQLIESLVKKIKYTNRLEALELDQINLTAKSAAIISKSLHKVPNLSLLGLAWNPLGEGLNDLINQLSCVPHLETLYLEYVMMTKEQVHDLTTAVRHSNIHYLYSFYHDQKGNPLPEEEWESEEDWKWRYPSLFPEELNPFTSQSHPGQPVPIEITAQGPKAKLAYENALKTGNVKVFRTRIMLIGQDRAGKTSLKKSFLGLPFDPEEQSTDGIDVDPSKFEFEVSQVKNWQRTDEKFVSQFLNDLARQVAGELETEETKMDPQDQSKETSSKGNEGNARKMEARTDIGPEINQVSVREEKTEKPQAHRMTSHSENANRKPAVPQLTFDPTLPPDEFTRLLVQHLEGLSLPTDDTAMENHMTLDLWDFAGQQLYYASYPVFLSPRAVYLLVYNLSKGLKEIAQPCVRQGIHEVILSNPNHETNLETLLSWLISVSTVCSSNREADGNKPKDLHYLRPPVFIVGTHADKPHGHIKSMESQIKKEIIGKELQHHVISPFFAVDNTQGSSGDGVVALQKRMLEVLKEEPYMGEEIPLRWLNFEKVIDALISKQIYHLNVEQLRIVARTKCFIADEEEFNIMVNFYHDLGIIIKHRSTVILKAQWLIDLFRQLITIPHFDKMDPVVRNYWKEVQDTGILSMELIEHVFSKFFLSGVVKDDILNMMEQFDLIARFAPSSNDVKYFVPAQLKAPPDDLFVDAPSSPSSSDPSPLYVNFCTGCVPHGLFTQVVSRSICWLSKTIVCTQTSPMCTPHEKGMKTGPTPCIKLYQNAAKLIIGNKITHNFILICKKRFIKIVLRQRNKKRQVLGDDSAEIAAQVWMFLEQTFHDLSLNPPYLGGLRYQFCVACPYCQLENKECRNHGTVCCTHEDCLHLLEINHGEPLNCAESSFPDELTVDGMDKWFAHGISQEMSPSSSFDIAQSYARHSGTIKDDVVDADDVEGLSLKLGDPWEAVARHLGFIDAEITAFRKENEKYSDKAFSMLEKWRQKKGSKATYRVLYDALCHEFVQRKDLAQEFCTFTCEPHTICYIQQMQTDANKVFSEIDLLVELNKVASNKGFIVSDNRGGGNCMFYALSEQLVVVKGIRISHKELRKSIVEYLKDVPTLPDRTNLFNFVHGYSSWDAYLTNMAADGTWGDHVILHGAANCFKTCIRVISSLSHQHDVIISPGCEVNSSNRLVLGHVHELHYVSLIESKRVPSEITARGPKAKLAYENALKTGNAKMFRTRIMLIGQDRAGKTSLRKSLVGLPFDPKEESTDGIDVDPSKFEFEVCQVKNWQRTDEKFVSPFLNDLARQVAGKLEMEEKIINPQVERPQYQSKETSSNKNEVSSRKMETRTNTVISNKTAVEPKDIVTEMNQVSISIGKGKTEKPQVHRMTSHSENANRKPAIPQLMFDPTLPPDEFTHLLVQHLEGLNLPTDNTAMENYMTLDLWDFAGQQLYYASYPVFLSPRAIYLLVYNLSKGLKEIAQPCVRQGIHEILLSNPNHETNLEILMSWLISVSTVCSSNREADGNKPKDLQYLRPPVFMVGTHADKPHGDITSMESQIKKEIIGKEFQDHVISPFFAVDNTQGSSGDGVVALQKRMLEVLKEEPYMGEEIPLRWLNFEKVIDALISKQTYHLNVEQLRIAARAMCFIAEEEEFDIMVNFYHDLGIIIKHRSTVILKAQWLIDLFRQLITIPHFDKMDPVVRNYWKKVQDTGILSMELIEDVFSKFLLQGVVKDDILNMMEHFDLIAKFAPSSNDVKYFVPAQLKAPPGVLCDVAPSSSDPCSLYVDFCVGCVPHGLFTQVVSRSICWLSERIACTQTSPMCTPHEKGMETGPTPCFKLYQNVANLIIGNENPHNFILICKKRFIKIVLRQRNQKRQVLRDNSAEIAAQVWMFLEQTFRDLSQNLPNLRGLRYQFCVACPYCEQDKKECRNHGTICCKHEDCLHLLKINRGEPLNCTESCSLDELTVDGVDKWFSHRTSQEMSPPSSPGTAESYLKHSGTIKDGVVVDDDIEGLSLQLGNSWEAVARRLKFNDEEIIAFHKENEEYSKKALKMLQKWKQKDGSDATYRVLYDALCHEFVKRKDLAERFCALLSARHAAE